MKEERIFIILILILNIFSLTVNTQLNLDVTEDLTSKDQLPDFAFSSVDNFLTDNSTWIDYPEDSDNNGLYDSITIDLNKPKYLQKSFYIYAL